MPELREYSIAVMETALRYALFAVTKKDSLVLEDVRLTIDVGRLSVALKQRALSVLASSSEDWAQDEFQGKKGFFQRVVKRHAVFSAIESQTVSKVTQCFSSAGNNSVVLSSVDPESRMTPLMMAVSLCNSPVSLEVAQLLLAMCRADDAVNAQNSVGDTALMMAIRASPTKENTQIVRELWSFSDLALSNNSRANAFHLGCEKNPALLLQILSESPSSALPPAAFAANTAGETPCFIAIRGSSNSNSNLNTTALVQRFCSDPRVAEHPKSVPLMHTLFHAAVLASNVAGLRVLLECEHLQSLLNATNKDQCTPLYIAMEMGSEEMQSMLLNHGADPRVGRSHPLMAQMIRTKFVPSYLAWCKSKPVLTSVSLSCCQLSSLPPALFSLRGALRVLDLSNNLLEVLPRQVLELSELEELILSNNSLRSGVNVDLLGLLRLRVLQLDGNPKLNADLGPLLLCKIRNSLSLDTSNLNLSVLSGDLFALCNQLEELALNDNVFCNEALDCVLAMPSLKSLWLHNNQLTTFPVSSSWTQLELLKVSNNKIKVLPVLGQKIREVWLEGNHLSVFTVAHVGPAMRRLWLDGNQISSIVPDAGGAAQLDCLSMKNNQIHEVPSVFITSLTRLWLDGNLISQLPVAFSQLVNLVCLSLSENPLREFPVQIATLKQLAELSLNDCLLEQIDPRIGHLANLRKLYLRSNRIVFLPQTIGLMNGLSIIDVSGNATLMSPPPATVRCGTQVSRFAVLMCLD